MNDDKKCFTSNGYDLSNLRSYKSDLRDYAERLYVRNGTGKGNITYRDRFLVRDLQGRYWWYYKKSSSWSQSNRCDIYIQSSLVVTLVL